MLFGEGIFATIGMSFAFFQKKGAMADEAAFLGERHRVQRKMLNPVFSIAHMREMGMCPRVYIQVKGTSH